MKTAVRALVRFLLALVPAALKAWRAGRKSAGVLLDRGAAEQRAADQAADETIGRQAEERADELANAGDTDLDRRRDRWVR